MAGGLLGIPIPPEETNTGPVCTGGPGAVPGGLDSKNGEGHMRVHWGFISYKGDSFSIAAALYPRAVCVLSAEATKTAVGLSKRSVS